MTVAATKEHGLAEHSCEAELVSGNSSLTVVKGASQVDVDVMGADLGLGVPVVAFQVKKSAFDADMTYKIYSLQGHPQLLRTITGGDFYRAADTDMDGRVEIWTHDAGAASGFEGVPFGDFDFPPTVVLLFEDRRLMDVSREFQSEFDRQITQVRAQLASRQLAEFKRSDGKLERILPAEMSELRDLMMAKIGVLEIVWAYLYSGREQEAWRALAEMWPAADFDRIRTSIAGAQASGIRSEVDGVEPPDRTARKKRHVEVFNLAEQTKTVGSTPTTIGSFQNSEKTDANSSPLVDVAAPQSILLYVPRPQEVENGVSRTGVEVDLVIDGAGKINSVKLVNKADNGPIGDSVLAASAGWKFIPAIRHGKAVASRILLTVSPFQ